MFGLLAAMVWLVGIVLTHYTVSDINNHVWLVAVPPVCYRKTQLSTLCPVHFVTKPVVSLKVLFHFSFSPNTIWLTVFSASPHRQLLLLTLVL